MLAHQVEEYGYPGGFPTVTNLMVMGEKDIPDRYPLNANQCMISNTLLTYFFYIAAISFPGLIWLGLAQVGLGLFQVLAHGIAVPVRIKRLYNPGLATTLFLFLPVGIYYIRYVTTNNLASTGDFVLGFFVTFGAVVALFLLPIILLRSKQSKYPFSEAEMRRFAG
ncbi:HXXEE domain-containing protein [Cedecea colo]